MGVIGIVILNWNSYDVVKQCIDGIQEYICCEIEVIIVDNGSKDDSRTRLATEFPQVTLLVNNENLGFARGNNVGIRYCKKKGIGQILLLNNDTIITEDFLTKMSAFLDDHEKVAVVQPIILQYPTGEIWSAGGQFIRSLSISKSIGAGEAYKKLRESSPYEVDWVTGCCMLIKMEVIDKIGGLNEKFFAYHEDVDFCLSVKKSGFRLYCIPEVSLEHIGGYSSKKQSKDGYLSPYVHYLNARNSIYVVRLHTKNYNLPLTIFYQAIKFGGYSAYFILRGRFSKLKELWRGINDGIYDELGQRVV